MRKYATICYYLMLVAAFALDHAPALAPRRVVSIYDGDTLRLEGEAASVRIAGIDAPELSQPFGRAARDRLRLLALGKTALLTPASGRDKWGRTLATVTVDGADLGLTLVAEGLAYAWHPQGTKAPPGWPALVAAEAHARAEGRGAWADATAVRPWDYRARPKPTLNRVDQTNSLIGRELNPVTLEKPGKSSTTAPQPIEAELLRLHNTARAAKGLPPLALDHRLALAARWQANDCARMGRLTHTGSDGSSPLVRIRRAGYPFRSYDGANENAWAGSAGYPWTAAQMVRAWMTSTVGHKETMLGRYEHFGAAAATGKRGERYAVTCFGRTR